MEAYWWLGAFAVLIAIELATMGLTTVWFAGGALVAFIAALVGAPLPVQIALFVIVSFILLLLVRPIASKSMKGKETKTNADSLIGQTARVTEDIQNTLGQGTAVVNGLEWTARAEKDEDVIPAGSLVTIVRISGVKLIVRKEN